MISFTISFLIAGVLFSAIAYGFVRFIFRDAILDALSDVHGYSEAMVDRAKTTIRGNARSLFASVLVIIWSLYSMFDLGFEPIVASASVLISFLVAVLSTISMLSTARHFTITGYHHYQKKLDEHLPQLSEVTRPW